MVAVFSVFAILPFLDLKEMGIGLAAAILIDATIVRAVLLPATMMLLGDRNWYLPRWLEWLPNLEHERSVEPTVPARPRPLSSRPPDLTTRLRRPFRREATPQATRLQTGRHPCRSQQPIQSLFGRVQAQLQLDWEAAVVLTGTAIVGLHVADDSFVHPEAGTSALDHLAAGWCRGGAHGSPPSPTGGYVQGLRATIAIVVGVPRARDRSDLGRVRGGHGRAVRRRLHRPSGRSLPGWCSSGSAARCCGGLGGATTACGDGTSAEALVVSAAAVVGAVDRLSRRPWLRGDSCDAQERPRGEPRRAYENVSFTTSDGLELEGWYVPSKNGAAVIAFPGRSGPQAHTRMLVRHGYGVLLFDRRGEGDSQGASNMFGWGGDRDILAAIDFLKARPDVDPDRIGGIGFSVGGELMLQAAAETDELAAVVSEGAGTRWLAEEMEESQTAPLKWLSLPLYVVKTAAVAVFSNTAPPPKLTDLVASDRAAALPDLGAQRRERRDDEPCLLPACGGPKQIWAMPEAMHVRGLEARPKEYEQRVVGFFDRTLLARA